LVAPAVRLGLAGDLPLPASASGTANATAPPITNRTIERAELDGAKVARHVGECAAVMLERGRLNIGPAELLTSPLRQEYVCVRLRAIGGVRGAARREVWHA